MLQFRLAIGMIFILILLACSYGCNTRFAVSADNSVYYPDKWKEGGDPRKPMFAGSGYGESHSAGSKSGMGGMQSGK